MPTTLAEVWFPVLVQALLAMVIAAALVALSFAIGRRVKNKVKDMPYECGIAPPATPAPLQRQVLTWSRCSSSCSTSKLSSSTRGRCFQAVEDVRLLGNVSLRLLVLAGFFFIWKKGVRVRTGSRLAVPPVTPSNVAPSDLRAEPRRAELVSRNDSRNLSANPLAVAFDTCATNAKFEFNELTIEMDAGEYRQRAALA